MPLPARFIGYIFGYVRKAPRRADDHNQTPALVAQLGRIKRLEAATKKFIPIVVEWRTARTKTFVATDGFRSAVERAQTQKAVLVVGDVLGLLSATPADSIDACVDRLDDLPVKLLDAASMRLWGAMADSEKRLIVSSAQRVSSSRSEAVKRGQKSSVRVRVAPTTANAQAASRALTQRTDRRAERHRAFVEQIEQKLPPGEQLTAAVLRNALNESGIPSARGGRWSYVTARDLLARLARMGRG